MRRYSSIFKGSNRDSIAETATLDSSSQDLVAAEKVAATDSASSSPPLESDGRPVVDRDDDETGTIVSTVMEPPAVKVKRLDWYYSRWTKTWKYKNMGARVLAESRPLGMGVKGGGNSEWKQYCFVVIRRIPHNVDRSKVQPTFEFAIQSPYLLKACKDVIGIVPGISWNAEPLHLDAKLIVACEPSFRAYRDNLAAKPRKSRSIEEEHILTSVNVLLDYLQSDYRNTLATIKHLTSHGEITFELLYALFVPHSIFLTECPVTGEPQALELLTSAVRETMSGFVWELKCEYIEAIDSNGTPGSKGFGRVERPVYITPFEGTMKINTLDVFPLRYHDRAEELKKELLERGKKWTGLDGIHHMYYVGTAAIKSPQNPNKVLKYNLNSRIMIDRGNFRRVNPNYTIPVPKASANALPDRDYSQEEYTMQRTFGITRNNNNQGVDDPTTKSKVKSEVKDLTDEELMMASPVIFGFSLTDKLWLEFNVQYVQEIKWNDEAFANLVLPEERKTLLQSLVEAHNEEIGFDDFIHGKGQGLVVNLFGPPGVGKTMSAEATSEHVRRPLYIVGAGDLGTAAQVLDQNLTQVFDIATTWKAIVLIDEADVFLEERSLHNLERNAMVAVFLRHLEYYRGILFLTTNRVRTFDEAFLSRIHIALHFTSLPTEAKEKVWKAFLAKVGCVVANAPESGSSISEEELKQLAGKDINGREIKNAVRTAKSLAMGRKQELQYEHLNQVLEVLSQFGAEFAAHSDSMKSLYG